MKLFRWKTPRVVATVRRMVSPRGEMVFSTPVKMVLKHVRRGEERRVALGDFWLVVEAKSFEECYQKLVHEMFDRCEQVAMATDDDLTSLGLEFKRRFWKRILEVRLMAGDLQTEIEDIKARLC